MSNQEYLIPFGIDGRQFFQDLNDIEAGTDKMAANVQQATKEMQKGFLTASEGGEKLSSVITKNGQKAIELRDNARTLGQDLGKALDGSKIGKEFENKLQKIGDVFNRVAKEANKPIKFNIDTAKLAEFERALEGGANDMKVLAEVTAYAKTQLEGLDPNSQEFKDLANNIEVADSFLEAFGQTAEGVENKNKSLKSELRQLKADMAALEQAGKGDSEQFLNMAIRAGQLEDQIGDVSQRVRILASDTKYIDAGVQAVTGLAGAFTAGQGAVALFAGESEEAQKIIQKVTGAMAVLQGIQAVANALNKDSALSVLFFSKAQKAATVSTEVHAAAVGTDAAVTTTATTATKAFTAALLSNPLTLIALAVTAVVTALIAFISSSDDAEEATKSLNEALERQNLLLKLDEGGVKRRTDLLVAEAKAKGASESELTKIEGKGLQERLNLRKAAQKENINLYNQALNSGKVSAEDLKKLNDQILNDKETVADLENEVTIKGFELQEKTRKETADSLKKQQEAGKKAADDRKKQAEEDKKILEQKQKFTVELRDAYIATIKDQYIKEREEAAAATADKIQALNNEIILSKEAGEKRKQTIVLLEAGLKDRLAEINKKEAEDRAVLEFAAQQQLAELRAEGLDRELEVLKLGYVEKRKQINEQFKDEMDLRNQLITAINVEEAAKTKKITDDANREKISKQEEQAVLEVETAAKFIGDFAGIEEAKQVEVFKVRIKYANAMLALLLAQGNAENSVVVLQAKKQIIELEKGLKDATKSQDKASGKGIFNLQTLLFGDKGAEDNAAMGAAFDKQKQAIADITSFAVDQYQRQIDKKQEVIDQYNNELSDLEDRLNDEKALKEEGLANNVAVIEQEIAAKKAARDAEIKQQEELQKKQQNIQKLQFALDTATQASNLITASTEIFKSLAGIPFIGVPLAITTIALMTGAFVASKVKALQVIGDGNKKSFGKGGTIDGPSHEAGGVKYMAVDGSGDVVELEGGEKVTNKRASMKYGNLLDAINEDRIHGMNDDALRALLAPLGIRLNEDEHREALQVARDRDELKVTVSAPVNDISPKMAEIGENVKYLAERKRNDAERWEDDKYLYIRKGHKTTKIKK